MLNRRKKEIKYEKCYRTVTKRIHSIAPGWDRIMCDISMVKDCPDTNIPQIMDDIKMRVKDIQDIINGEKKNT